MALCRYHPWRHQSDYRVALAETGIPPLASQTGIVVVMKKKEITFPSQYPCIYNNRISMLAQRIKIKKVTF